MSSGPTSPAVLTAPIDERSTAVALGDELPEFLTLVAYDALG